MRVSPCVTGARLTLHLFLLPSSLHPTPYTLPKHEYFRRSCRQSYGEQWPKRRDPQVPQVSPLLEGVHVYVAILVLPCAALLSLR